jgi:hypothetical protein
MKTFHRVSSRNTNDRQSKTVEYVREFTPALSLEERVGQKTNRFLTGRTLLVRSACLMCLFFPLSVKIYAQSTSGTVVGTITDSTQAVLVGASVTLTDMATGVARTMTSSSTGTYEFVYLLPDVYKLDVQAPGFEHFTELNIRVEVALSTRVDAVLQVGSAGQSVEVTTAAPLMETQQASIAQVVEGRAVTDMPLNGRSVYNLAEVAPGVVPLPNVQSSTATGAAVPGFGGGDYEFSGGIANAGTFYLDGGLLNVTYDNELPFTPSQDAIQEFNIETANISPEFGGTEDGVVTMVTKSGTNEFHGSAFDYLRNTVLNANTFFSDRAHLARPPFIQNQFGATTGGPIKKDKIFFFGSYEGITDDTGSTTTYTVPTASAEGGMFTSTIIDPGTFDPTYTTFTPYTAANCPATDTVTNGECTFTNNQIPSTRFDSSAVAMLPWWASPTSSAVTNNYTVNTNTLTGVNQFLGRVDWAISGKQHLFARYLYQTESVTNPPPYGDPAMAANTTLSGQSDHQAILGDDYTFNSTTLLSVRLGYLRNASHSHPACLPCNLSFTGWPAATIAQLSKPGPFIPGVRVSGFSANGGGGIDVPVRVENDSISGTVTKILGRHTLLFGGEFMRRPDDYGQDNSILDEGFTFTNDFSGNAFANYLLGFPEETTNLSANYPAGITYYAGVFIGDTFQYNSRLTIDAGLRWEYPGYFTERHNSQGVFLQNATSPLAAQTGLPLNGNFVLVDTPAYPGRATMYPHYDMFSPRLGIDYRLTNRDVIRAAFGITDAAQAAFEVKDAPYSNPVNDAYTTIAATTTPVNAFHNPYPGGINEAPGHNPSTYEAAVNGQSILAPLPKEPGSYMMGWNVAYERDLGHQTTVDIAYVGNKAEHLPSAGGNTSNGLELDQLPDRYDFMGNALLTPVTNPFYGLISSSSSIAGRTIPAGQLLRPYPQYFNLADGASYTFFMRYNGLQAKVQKRMAGAGNLMISYTWSSSYGNTDSLTFFGNYNPGEIQDVYNLKAENSQSSFNLPQVLVASYVYDLPFGKGQRFLGSLGDAMNIFASGWGIAGITSYESGWPLVITAQPSYLSTNFGAGITRPNVTAGCKTVNSAGSAASRISAWFNTSCFTQPGEYAFGNEPRVDPTLRNQGTADWDLSFVKNTPLHEQLKLQFRAEMFNAFNRVQFAAPNTTCCSNSNATFGVVSGQQNNPRQVQFALKLIY